MFVHCHCYVTYRMSSSCEQTCSDTCVTSQPGPRLRRKDALSPGALSEVTTESSPSVPARPLDSVAVRLWKHLQKFVTKLALDTSQVYFLDSTRGMVLVILTWLVLVGSETLMVLFVFLPIRDFAYDAGNVAISLLLAFLVGVSHLRTVFTDPVSNMLHCTNLWCD